MHRFYCPNADFSLPKIMINDSTEIHHLKSVLRMKKGVKVEIFNGRGDEILGVIESLNDKGVDVTVVSRQKSQVRGPKIILACAIPKKAKFEFIIEKATELGVDEIIPMQTARTEVVISGDRKERKNARYQAVAVNAAKQSGRSVMPRVSDITLFKDVIANASENTLKLIPCLIGERKNLRDALSATQNMKSIIFLIGPEGDFTSQEVELALKNGFLPVSLGETTLKVDTAALVVVAFAKLMSQ